MFGALAAAAVLPFDRAAFESAVRAGGTGVESSLRAFAAAFDQTQQRPIEPIRRFPEKRFPRRPIRQAIPNSIGWSRASGPFPRRRSLGCSPAFGGSSISRSRLCARISRSGRDVAGRRSSNMAARPRVSPSPARRRNIWRWRWPTTTWRASPTKNRRIPSGARAARGRRGRRYDRRDHRIFSPARRGALRLAAQSLGRMDRKSRPAFSSGSIGWSTGAVAFAPTP